MSDGLFSVLFIALVVVAAVIHLLPVVGLVSARRVELLYGIAVDSPELAILLRHRAFLFGLLGAALIAGIFEESWRLPAVGFTLLSDVVYAALTLAHPGHNASLRRVLRADLVSIASLVIAGALLLAG